MVARTDLTPDQLRFMMSRLEDAVTGRRPMVRDRTTTEVNFSDPEVRTRFDEAMSHPELEGHAAWQRYADEVRARYEPTPRVEVRPRERDRTRVACPRPRRPARRSSWARRSPLPRLTARHTGHQRDGSSRSEDAVERLRTHGRDDASPPRTPRKAGPPGRRNASPSGRAGSRRSRGYGFVQFTVTVTGGASAEPVPPLAVNVTR
jgi:hypothetical protein